MDLHKEIRAMYTIQDGYFKEELLHVLSKLVEEVSDLRGEVMSLQNQIDSNSNK